MGVGVSLSLTEQVQIWREVSRPKPAEEGRVDRPFRRREADNGAVRQESMGIFQETTEALDRRRPQSPGQHGGALRESRHAGALLSPYLAKEAEGRERQRRTQQQSGKDHG